MALWPPLPPIAPAAEVCPLKETPCIPGSFVEDQQNLPECITSAIPSSNIQGWQGTTERFLIFIHRHLCFRLAGKIWQVTGMWGVQAVLAVFHMEQEDPELHGVQGHGAGDQPDAGCKQLQVAILVFFKEQTYQLEVHS
ncbi:hypothetical protein AAY473_006770 [Plecturocebus cupreus]